jgi:16S rRNA (cytosine1402-N4)-methyltransferase
MNNHIPVLLDPILSLFENNLKDKYIFDGTFGGGGYSQKFEKEGAKVFACDLDVNAIERNQIKDITLVQSNFKDYIKEFQDSYFDLIVVDLGFSNNQLTIDDKGFSYLKSDQLLDLRYDDQIGKSASEVLLKISEDELGKILYENSGEIFARKIAKTICDQRKNMSQILVKDLENWVIESIPGKFKNKKMQVLSRVWQSLRIYINQEFENLKEFLKHAPNKLKVDGYLCIVNFHSLEDKITTKIFRDLSKTFDKDQYGNKGQYFELISRKPITPDENELNSNPQSRSATLRILRKCLEQNK